MEMVKVKPGDSSKRWCFQWMMQRYSDNLKTLSNQRSLSPSMPMRILRIWYGSTNNPLINIFLYFHCLFAWQEKFSVSHLKLAGIKFLEFPDMLSRIIYMFNIYLKWNKILWEYLSNSSKQKQTNKQIMKTNKNNKENHTHWQWPELVPWPWSLKC